MPEQKSESRPVLRYEFDYFKKDTERELGYVKDRGKGHEKRIKELEDKVVLMGFSIQSMQTVLDELEKQVQGPRKLISTVLTTAIISGAVSVFYSLFG